jgi:hypothetical protein
LLGGKNLQKQYGTGSLFWWDKKEACGFGEERKSREDEDVVAQLRRERNYFLMLFN